MSDLDSYLTRCYDLLLGSKGTAPATPSEGQEELCACAHLVSHEEEKPN